MGKLALEIANLNQFRDIQPFSFKFKLSIIPPIGARISKSYFPEMMQLILRQAASSNH
jgi:hypothetical protein